MKILNLLLTGVTLNLTKVGDTHLAELVCLAHFRPIISESRFNLSAVGPLISQIILFFPSQAKSGWTMSTVLAEKPHWQHVPQTAGVSQTANTPKTWE